jgi:predicted membrane-bound spermidine synthase
MSSSNKVRLKIVLFLIFALFGFSGLIYESIWTHYLKLILGHAAYAQTLVLSIFLGGLAIGAGLIARKNRVIEAPSELTP